MNTLDIIFLVILGLTGLRCLIRGLIAELGSRLAIVAALLSGFLLYQPAGRLLSGVAELGIFAPVIGFAVAALLAFLIVWLVSRSLQTIVETVRLQFLDRILGFVFGLMEGLVIVIVILLILDYQTFFDTEALLSGSIFAQVLLPLISATLPAVIPEAGSA